MVNRRPILYTPLLSAIFQHKYRSAPFDALLVAVILVYRPLLRDETSSLVAPHPSSGKMRSLTMDAAEHHSDIADTRYNI